MMPSSVEPNWGDNHKVNNHKYIHLKKTVNAAKEKDVLLHKVVKIRDLCWKRPEYQFLDTPLIK